MCEWFEMLGGTLRRLTLRTSDRKEEHALWNMVIRTQVKAISEEQHGARDRFAAASYAAHGPK